jgi:hypothetical protein
VKLLERIHLDLYESLLAGLLSGIRYLMILINNAIKVTSMRFLKQKSDVAMTLVNWKELIFNKYNKYIKTLYTNNGGEYGNKKITKWVSKLRITHEKIVLHTSKHNSMTE